MVLEHDFVRFPELTNSQMDFFYFDSPHKQLIEDFEAEIIRVHDGDTVTLRIKERDFDFPLRFAGTDAKELGEGGEDAQLFLENILLNEMVTIKMNKKQRVGKFGRLLGTIIHKGQDMSALMINTGRSTTFAAKDEGKLPNLDNELKVNF